MVEDDFDRKWNSNIPQITFQRCKNHGFTFPFIYLDSRTQAGTISPRMKNWFEG